MSTAAPAVPLNSQIIGRAHYAARALLERTVAHEGLVFDQQIALNAVAAAGGAVEHDRIVEQLTGSLKIDATRARALITELVGLGIASMREGGESDAVQVELTDEGKAVRARTAEAVADVAARIYAGIAPDDLVTAGRVLTLLTEHANAELAAGA
ncbi:MarR family transcriptional regulator [Streptomyces sp. NPDC050504]|uniref:MarR family transcriptional regulator n=1 Tax=Streptomyces sp. NPDC050504 TaxID=3365618 RepID=UPI0037B31F8C